MKNKYPVRAVNETGDTTIDVQLIQVPDSAITAGSGVVSLATATGDVTGPSSATDNAITRFNGTTGKVVQNSAAFVDDNGNVYAPNVAGGSISVATAAGTTTLTVASKGTQVFTGVTTQTVVLPVVTTLPQIGFSYHIINDSTGALTVNSSGANLVQTIPAGGRALITCILLTGTSAASWASTLIPANLEAGNQTSNIGYLNIPQNSQSAAYELVLSDSGKHILHPTADNNPRTFTIPANGSVAFPIGTAITFINQINTLTIAITTDTLTWAEDNTTGSRAIAAGGMATIIKVASTQWVISGVQVT